MKKIIKTIYIFISLSLLATCSNVGIFYSLEKEEKILDPNNLNNKANFSNLFKVGSYYFGNGGKNVYFRSDSSDAALDDWESLTLPNGSDETPAGVDNDAFSSDAVVTSMVSDGTEIFISRISYDGSSIVSGIYSLTIPADPSDTVSTTWTTLAKSVVSKSGSFTTNVYKLHLAGNELYINHLTFDYDSVNDDTASINDSLLYHIAVADTGTLDNDIATNGNVTPISLTGFWNSDGDKVEVTKIASSGTNYWMILNADDGGSTPADNKVLRAPNGSPEAFVNVTLPSEARFVDVYEINATKVIVSTTDSTIFTSDDGATLTHHTDLNVSNVFLKGFENINGLGTITTDQLVVGTSANIGDSTYDGEGYFHLDVSNADDADWSWIAINGSFSEINNYNSSDLSSATVNGFHFDSGSDRLFAYTRNAGVWMNIVDPDDSSSRIWSLE